MMWARIRQFLAPPVFAGDEEKTRVARLLHVTLLSLAAIGLAAAGLGVFAEGSNPSVLLGVAAVALLLLALWATMRQGYVQWVSVAVVLLIFVLSVGAVYALGTIRAPITAIFFLSVAVAGLFLGIRGIVAFTAASLVALMGLLWAELAGLLPPALQGPVGLAQWLSWASALTGVAVFFGVAIRSLNVALKRAQDSAFELEEERAHLEETVEERTRDLARRTRYLEATTTIARDIASELDPQTLLPRIVRSISEQFGFYHSGVFLIDPTGEWAELQAASSKGGQRMMARGHRLQVGKEGVVGYVTAHGESRVALDTGQDAVYFDNPDLTETRSEVALPLRARGEIIGALDVQSREPSAFGPDDVVVLQMLADQAAMAISNARLFRRAEESVQVERQAYGELSRQAWQEMLHTQPDLGFVSYEQGLSPIGDLWESQMERAIQTGGIATEGGDDRTLAVPVKARGQVIGVFDARKPEGAGEWTAEEIALLESLAEQLGVALESARLYQDTQRRAARDRLLGDITARVRETLDVDTVLQTAVREMRLALDIAAVEVRLDTEPGEGGNGQNV